MTDKAAHGQGSGGAKGPDELRRQIERTRSELGDTVEELAGKVDVKGRARARAADLRDKAGAMTVQLRSSAAMAGHTVQDRASHAGHTVQDKAAQAGHTVQFRATRAGHAVEHNLPTPVRTAVQAGARHPRPVLVVGVAAVGALIAVEVLRRRHAGR
ncbi:DUF3618 domain-containing protein [Streptomyces sp. AC555_RSS877]|uniref:DUF3618 domain-containing protein n=1 Tax=Streptomyces sp. AC555_RSS877 TaxID=2823688 RepID=UPI001C280E93|nr:DUF3618 domain-containing protein [Streptomyces sp. AC555_RSS877]